MGRRVLVCGGRDYDDYPAVRAFLDDQHKTEPFSCVIHGDARGADRLADFWARRRNVPIERYPAKWDLYDKAAGPIRNQEMIDKARPDMVVAFPGGVGTADMVHRARTAHIMVIEVNSITSR